MSYSNLEISVYDREFDADLEGVLEITEVRGLSPWPGSIHTAPSDLDYHGWVEVNWIVHPKAVDTWIVNHPKLLEEVHERALELVKESDR